MWTSLLLACVVAGQDDPSTDPLDGDDLVALNRGFVEAHRIEDNEFIYQEKIAEAIERARQAEGRRLRLVAEVDRVTTSAVWVNLLPEDRAVLEPQVRFAAEDADVKFYVGASGPLNLGGTVAGGSPVGALKVGEFVPIETAKTLRKGDRLAITGVVEAVKPAPSMLGRRPVEVAGFVIGGSPVVEKVP